MLITQKKKGTNQQMVEIHITQYHKSFSITMPNVGGVNINYVCSKAGYYLWLYNKPSIRYTHTGGEQN